MSTNQIQVTPLKKISTPGGDVLHALKSSEQDFKGFGEIYFSLIEKNAIKAWKRHTQMSMNLVVPFGLARFIFLDEGDKKFIVHEIGATNYVRLSVPPGIWFGFQGIHINPSLIVNIANIPHDPEEVERLLPEDIEYNWELI
jgi:dTDP-4-dehydrorhamnose 3,5-epimerase